MENEIFWAMLPEGLEPYFEIESYEKTENKFMIVLLEKNKIPVNLPKKFQNKKVVNTLIKKIIIDSFPIRGLKGELVVKRRAWQFEGEKELYKRSLEICSKGTKLEKGFANFLKEFSGEFPDSLEPGGLVEQFTSKDVYETIQESLK